jgi:hypothetical protein
MVMTSATAAVGRSIDADQLTPTWIETDARSGQDHPWRSIAAVAEALAAWRSAERDLARVTAADPAWQSLSARLVESRATYHRLVEARRSPMRG